MEKETSKQIEEFLKKSFELYDYFKSGASEQVPFSPQHLYIEPTNLCNLNCQHCARSSIKRKMVLMPNNVFQAVLGQLKKTNWQVKITLTGQGEPLLHQNILEFVKTTKEKGFFVSIITNGTVLTESLGEALIKAGLDRIQFSFDSVVKETYESIRRGANFEKTLGNILRFLEINEKLCHPCFVSISSVQSEKPAKEKDIFLEFWKKRLVDNVFLAPLSSLQGKSEMSNKAKTAGKRQACVLPFLNISVKADGNVVGCPHDYDNAYIVGNVLENDLADIWNNEKMRFLRNAILEGKFDYFKNIGHDCENCNNCFIGYGVDDFLKDYFLRMEKNLEPYFTKNKDA
ncbi:radical SAM protein [Candidatus Parcubacteria bacterium]|nr:radical SAM protein [Candidatus Parcubacteria bacterium]